MRTIYNYIKENKVLLIMDIIVCVLLLFYITKMERKITYWTDRANYWEKSYDESYQNRIDLMDMYWNTQDTLILYKDKYHDLLKSK